MWVSRFSSGIWILTFDIWVLFVFPDQDAMRKRNLDPLFVKSDLNPSPQFPSYLPLLERGRFYDGSNDQLGLSESLHTEYLQGLQEGALPGFFRRHLFSDLSENFHDPIHLLAV